MRQRWKAIKVKSWRVWFSLVTEFLSQWNMVDALFSKGTLIILSSDAIMLRVVSSMSIQPTPVMPYVPNQTP